MLKTCHLCTDTFRWPSLPICACKTLDRCPACHFEQLSTPGKFGKCDVCRTERCEVGTLSLIPIVSYFYVWSQARLYVALHKLDRRTWTIKPAYLPRFLFNLWYIVSIICIVASFVFIVPYSDYGSAEDDPPMYWFVVICILWAVESACSALCFSTESLSPNPNASSCFDREHVSLFAAILFQWVSVIVICATSWASSPTRNALLLGTFIASRIPGWIVDAVIVLVLRRSQQSSSIYDPPQSAHHSSSNQLQVVSPSVVYSISSSSSSSESGHVDAERIGDEEQTSESLDLVQSDNSVSVDIRLGD